MHVHYGFMQLPNIPLALTLGEHVGLPIDIDAVIYILGRNHGVVWCFIGWLQGSVAGSFVRRADREIMTDEYKKWPQIFNNDSTLTSALLDRLLHHAESVLIEGKSYRMKDQIES
jgi:hypothetical protein